MALAAWTFGLGYRSFVHGQLELTPGYKKIRKPLRILVRKSRVNGPQEDKDDKITLKAILENQAVGIELAQWRFQVAGFGTSAAELSGRTGGVGYLIIIFS